LLTRHTVRVLLLILATIPCALPAAEKLPEVEGSKITVTKSAVEVGNEETFAVDSTYRSQFIYPSNWGQAGVFRVRSAESLPSGAITFGIGAEYYSINDAPNFGTGSEASTISESLFVGWAPTDRWTISAMRRSSSTTFGTPAQLIASLGDLNFSTMYSFPLSQSLAIAPIGNFLIASDFNKISPDGNTLSAGLGGALSYSFYPTFNLPLFLHFNALYSMPQIRGRTLPGISQETFFNFSRFHTVTLSLAGEIKLGDFIPFIEVMDTIEAGSGIPFGSNPSKLSFGTRITPLSNKSLAMLVGADVALGRGVTPGVPFSPGYQILGQLSYTVAVNQTERKHYLTTQDVNVVDRKFVIKKTIAFKVGSAELLPESYGLLDQIAKVIQDNHVKKLLIVGHTDSSASEDYNLKLSQDRATSVKKYLVGKDIGEDTLIAQGYGKRKPRASNTTEEGRALNRRVEFYMLD
jgi:outer membrane protein OmpA-like peptidoglycan-associated protein